MTARNIDVESTPSEGGQALPASAGSAFDRLRKAQEMIEAVKRFTPEKVWEYPPPAKPWRPTTPPAKSCWMGRNFMTPNKQLGSNNDNSFGLSAWTLDAAKDYCDEKIEFEVLDKIE